MSSGGKLHTVSAPHRPALQEAWNVAEEESYKAGAPFKDRNRVWQNERDPDENLVGAVLIKYCAMQGWDWS